MSDDMKDVEYLQVLVEGLVDHPQDVKIKREIDEMGVLLTLDLNPEDMGKVIGKKGNTAKAIRTLLRVMGMKHHARVTLRINEPEGGRKMGTTTGTSSAAAAVDEAMQDLKSM